MVINFFVKEIKTNPFKSKGDLLGTTGHQVR